MHLAAYVTGTVPHSLQCIYVPVWSISGFQGLQVFLVNISGVQCMRPIRGLKCVILCHVCNVSWRE